MNRRFVRSLLLAALLLLTFGAALFLFASLPHRSNQRPQCESTRNPALQPASKTRMEIRLRETVFRIQMRLRNSATLRRSTPIRSITTGGF